MGNDAWKKVESLIEYTLGTDRDIICYNPTRIILSGAVDPNEGSASAQGDTSADRGYVNASLVQEPDLGLNPPTSGTPYRRRWWVAAQVSPARSLLLFLYQVEPHMGLPNASRANLRHHHLGLPIFRPRSKIRSILSFRCF